MKIKKEFVDLIYNKKKQFEFRNDIDKSGVYQIKDKYFILNLIHTSYDFKIKKIHKVFTEEPYYYFCGYEITEQEYNWIKNNVDYFIDSDGKTFIVVYEWVEIELKELEEVE